MKIYSFLTHWFWVYIEYNLKKKKSIIENIKRIEFGVNKFDRDKKKKNKFYNRDKIVLLINDIGKKNCSIYIENMNFKFPIPKL